MPVATPRPRFFKDVAAFRAWLEKNHERRAELWVGFYKKHAKKTGVTYREAVDEALCFGWIDGTIRRVDDDRYTHRFTPRKPKSTWSTVNIKRVGELRRAGRMHPAGLAAFQRRTPENSGVYGHENPHVMLSAAFEKRLRANRAAWTFFQERAPSYRRLAAAWVMSAKREETRERRLVALIEDSASGQVIKPMRWTKKDGKR
jgi:uncharacterized protein YdeI (YjbR/CyaY-like superfamily)